jgi:hypothetical protein
LEKALLAHAVLQHLRIDHSMALVTDLIGDKPDWDLPEIVVATDRPIYPRALQLAGKTSLTLSGAPLPAPEDVRIWVSLRLSETTPGRFAGNLTSETCFDGRGSGADWHPIEGLNTDTEEVLSHSLRGRTSRSRATYDLKNGCLELRFPGDMLALGQLMAALQQTTQLTLSHGIQAQVVVSLEFLKSPSLVAAAGKKVSNKIGAAGFSAAVKGRVLTVKSSLKMGGGGFRRADYADLQALLVPVMSETNRRLFIEVE